MGLCAAVGGQKYQMVVAFVVVMLSIFSQFGEFFPFLSRSLNHLLSFGRHQNHAHHLIFDVTF